MAPRECHSLEANVCWRLMYAPLDKCDFGRPRHTCGDNVSVHYVGWWLKVVGVIRAGIYLSRQTLPTKKGFDDDAASWD